MDLAAVHADSVSRQSDDALDPNLRTIARPAKNDDVAALGQRREDARRIWENKERGQGSAAVAVGILHCEQFVADQQRWFHRARGNVEWLRNRGCSGGKNKQDTGDYGYANDQS